MDQKKIGAFIASRRHALGLTQAQLGEKLGARYGTARLKRTMTIQDGTPIPFAALAVGEDLFLPYLNTKNAPEKIAEHSDACAIFEISFQ